MNYVAFMMSALVFLISSVAENAKADMLEQSDALITTVTNESRLLPYLNPALKSAGAVGRVYYEAACIGDGLNHPVPFPEIKIRTSLKAKSGLLALQEIFGDEENIKIAEDKAGVVRIFIGNFRDEFLKTKIPTLEFNQFEQYDSVIAVGAIWRNDHVKRAATELGKRLFAIPLDRTVPSPDPGLPHLPTLIKDITIDQALDQISKTFNQIIFYGVCSSSGELMIYSYPISGN